MQGVVKEEDRHTEKERASQTLTDTGKTKLEDGRHRQERGRGKQ